MNVEGIRVTGRIPQLPPPPAPNIFCAFFLYHACAMREKKPAAIWPVNINTGLTSKPVSNKQLTSAQT